MRLRNLLIWSALLIALPTVLLWIYIAQPSLKSSAPSTAEVSPERLEKHVLALSEKFSPRSYAHFRNLNLAADYIATELKAIDSGGELTDQFFEVDRSRYRNISLFLNDEKPGPRIVVGAHYDGYLEFPAADDNASGVAGLIELARLVGRGREIEFPIEFVAYPLEEPPHYATPAMGSSFHARNLKKGNQDVKLMISLEMIGYFSDELGSQRYPNGLLHLMYPLRGNFIAVIGRTDMRDVVKNFKIGMKGTTDLPVYSIAAPAALPGIDFSDHRNYWEQGFPAIMVSDTAFYRNQAYHTAEDTADRLDYLRMSETVVAVFEALKSME
ncbi:UNVERIFIED_CONTAM: hypothetical protein GTU68_059720 [Idotea baltica]|nr:hypothetical protein [Idotea baltica]